MLEGFGIHEKINGISAAGAVLHYLSETQHDKLKHITVIRYLANHDYVWLDRFTIRNLELFQSNHPEGVALIDVIDHTQTAMGGRLLRQWLAFPLKDKKSIVHRHHIVKTFTEQSEALEAVTSVLQEMMDLDRVVAKIATERVSPRALVQLVASLKHIEPLKEKLLAVQSKELQALANRLAECNVWIDLLTQTLHPEAPVLVSKGNVIANGFSEELDSLRDLQFSSKAYLDKMLERETERTQIPSLKIAFNNVFGYYIEVRNAHKDKVPEEWIRKQTLVNAERYITEELKEFETKIVTAEEQIQALEQRLFQELIQKLQKELPILKTNASALATLDCLSSFAVSAVKNHYCCPEINESDSIVVKGGRHPVIEKQLPPGTPYIANDLTVDREACQIMMITGPNMSGKSAILRQTALICLLGQMGSFVPATTARIGLVDKIFTRVGASDNISMGASTFMVEMNETASILNNISERSLILLDEIGRGTSTYDGISIAWAIAEYLHEHPYRPKVLFATHYHELNEMTQAFERIQNFNVSVKEMEDKVLFLRKLSPGGSAHSFGIHVAKMAGMPQHVVRVATQKLKALEQVHGGDEETKKKAVKEEALQLSFFNLDDPLLETIREEIAELDIDRLTPVEALMQLHQLQRKLKISSTKK